VSATKYATTKIHRPRLSWGRSNSNSSGQDGNRPARCLLGHEISVRTGLQVPSGGVVSRAGPTFYFVASQINRTPSETDVADRHSEDSMHDSGSTNYLLHASRSPPRINSGALLRRHLVPTHPPLTAPFILGKRYAGRKPCSHASPALLSAV
jgi:hypothetical protein